MGGSLSDECGRGSALDGPEEGPGPRGSSSLWESDSEVSWAPRALSLKPRGVGACTGAAAGGAGAGCISRRAGRWRGDVPSSSEDEEEDAAAEYAARIDRWLEDKARNNTGGGIAGARALGVAPPFHGDPALGHLEREEALSSRPVGWRIPQDFGDGVEASELPRISSVMRGLDEPKLFLQRSETSLPIAPPVFVFHNVQVPRISPVVRGLDEPKLFFQRSESAEPTFTVHNGSGSPKSNASRARSTGQPHATSSCSAVAGCHALGREATDGPGTAACTAYRWQEQPNADFSGDEMDPETQLATRIDRSLAGGGDEHFNRAGITAEVVPRVVRVVEPVDSEPASVRFRQHEAASLRPEGRRMPPDFDEEEAARARQNLRCVPRPFTRRDPPPDIPSLQTPDLQGPCCEERRSEITPSVPKSAPANVIGVKHLPLVSGLGGMQRLDLTTKTSSLGSRPAGVNGNAAAQSFPRIEHAAAPVSWPLR